MRSPRQERRIAPCPMRATEADAGNGAMEDTMVPGFSDSECCIAEFRYQELLAEGDRQRRVAAAASPSPASRVQVMDSIRHRTGAVMALVRQILLAVHAPSRIATHIAFATGDMD